MNLHKLASIWKADLSGSGRKILIGNKEKKIGGRSGDEVGNGFVGDAIDGWGGRTVDFSLQKDLKTLVREKDKKRVCMAKEGYRC